MTQTIEQLTARVRELEEEKRIAELIAELEHIREQKNLLWFEFSIATQQLAAEQLNNKLLRDALQEYIDEHEECQDADDWMAMMCSMEARHTADEALALPHDTNALDAYVAEKVKEAGKFDMWKTNPYTKVLETSIEQLTKQRDLAVEALEKIAAPVRVDGTYNRCREACEILAKETLSAIKESEAK